MLEKLYGSWELNRWHCTLDGVFHNHPFGSDAQGRLTYNRDGTMSAILMQAERKSFAFPSLAKGSDDELIKAAQSYVSYAGHFELIGNEVHHHVEFSLLPNWIGWTLVRQVAWQGDLLLLSTVGEKTRTGRIVVNHLLWQLLMQP